MRVLHVTNWYPTKESPYTALWINRHIKSLDRFCENKVVHVEVKKGPFKLKLGDTEVEGNQSYVVTLPFQIWLVTELISYYLVRNVLKNEKGNFDIVNFHIAYPLCVFLKKLKHIAECPVVITEHWSAYHFHFGIKGSPALTKIKKMFSYADKIITVSNALKNDIIDFTSNTRLDFAIIPNIVDTSVFNFQPEQINTPVFFMVSQWKDPKDPFTIVRGFAKLIHDNPQIQLNIGGYGPQETLLLDLIGELKLSDNIHYLGKLDSVQIADYMRKSTAFIHISDYETFSVVCAEAINCGCPVLASDVGGIKEFITKENGLLISSKDNFVEAVQKMIKTNYRREEIAKEAAKKFSLGKIGETYYNVLASCNER